MKTVLWGKYTSILLNVIHDNSNSVNGFKAGNLKSTDHQYYDNNNRTIDRNKCIHNIFVQLFKRIHWNYVFESEIKTYNDSDISIVKSSSVVDFEKEMAGSVV